MTKWANDTGSEISAEEWKTIWNNVPTHPSAQ